MLFKSVLILAPLAQLVSAQYGCNPYGPKEVELFASYTPAYGGMETQVLCKNLDDNGCPMKLNGPYGPYDEKKCRIVEQIETKTTYECNNSDDVFDFKNKAESKKWKCQMPLPDN